ncbi:L-asparaginase [Salmonella enterica]|uniref:L-asparaginase n=2 Tax=Salmonella enterica I TaxID=59201 RepID=A0A5H5DXL9_SALPT|nr:L-asparaginase [Salmonella enterica subsp. enterica serovar Paratyphi A]EAA1831556.1 L-asparaginase [Salmonella enterica subsp. enterica serovar Napoli]EAA6340290.1 L-asparaginase [Salmonella enterica subsp. enterica serovar Veneziana]EAC0525377.1 L-asparaginase [Salmonella enterica subsp. enterica serovar Zaiman]EBH8142882.1 L-asparaginase [Salmonella enterica subsp. enterica serovar Paratyphi A str. AKU_12601]EBI2941066.1 L-asparaginase [Salmonella enterica]EBX8733624.1 L-asparaginase [S
MSRPGSLAISAPGCARHPYVLRVRCGGCAHAGTELAATVTPWNQASSHVDCFFPRNQ